MTWEFEGRGGDGSFILQTEGYEAGPKRHQLSCWDPGIMPLFAFFGTRPTWTRQVWTNCTGQAAYKRSDSQGMPVTVDIQGPVNATLEIGDKDII